MGLRGMLYDRYYNNVSTCETSAIWLNRSFHLKNSHLFSTGKTHSLNFYDPRSRINRKAGGEKITTAGKDDAIATFTTIRCMDHQLLFPVSLCVVSILGLAFVYELSVIKNNMGSNTYPSVYNGSIRKIMPIWVFDACLMSRRVETFVISLNQSFYRKTFRHREGLGRVVFDNLFFLFFYLIISGYVLA